MHRAVVLPGSLLRTSCSVRETRLQGQHCEVPLLAGLQSRLRGRKQKGDHWQGMGRDGGQLSGDRGAILQHAKVLEVDGSCHALQMVLV